MRILKKLLLMSVVLSLILTLTTIDSMNVKAATKPEKVVIKELVRNGKNNVTISWNKVSGAKGYEVYMKTESGKFKKIKTTTKKKFKKSGLKIEKAYTFKVRAYKKNNKKKVYGKFSTPVRKKMTKYEYLVEVLEPIDIKGAGIYTYSGTESRNMSGKAYYHGIYNPALSWNGNIVYNLNGKYKKMTYTFGCGEGREGTLQIYGDGELLQSNERTEYMLPKGCSVNISGVYIMDIKISPLMNIGNVKLYY